jgi:hypothetical protein
MARHWFLAWTTLLMLALLAPPVGAQDQEAIKLMVNRGVAFLKALQGPQGAWPEDSGRGSGSTSLAALALLECGVPAEDPAIVKAVEVVREASIRETGTYSLSLAIMFLDRLGDSDDVPLIESMAVRLMAGQGSTGGWTYTCPPIADSEMNRLATLIKRRNVLTGRGEVPRQTTTGKRVFTDLPVEIRRQLENVEVVRATRHDNFGDNSNTQFALLGLWVARRHGLPVEKALARVGARFRMSQRPTGGWSYNQGGEATPAMTCAGLLGLAVSYGIVEDAPENEKNKHKDKPDPGKDPAIRAGLLALGTAVGGPAINFGQHHRGPQGHASFYYLWSLERVGVIYGLDTIGRKNWYLWGATVLAATQSPDGSWQGAYARCGADTAFGLLFLRRANIARDLTATLRDRVADPGERVLRSGGVGGDALLGQQPANAFETGEKSQPGPEAKAKTTSDLDSDAARIGRRLIESSGDEQAVLLQKLKSGQGSAYTQALAAAIPKLDESAQKMTRQALADRLSDLKTASLRQWLQYDDREIRRAAALACAMKDDKSTVPDLIPLLDDREALVARAAHAALKSLTNQDYGPSANASSADRARAVAAWKEWWKRSGK